MREKLQGWYAGEVEKKINAGQNTSDIASEMGIPVMRYVSRTGNLPVGHLHARFSINDKRL